MNWLVRSVGIGAAFACAAALAGCNKPDSAASSVTAVHGRYAGVGVVDVGKDWSSGIVANRPANDPQAALTAHDDHVIVVVDTTTGAIKQCGDISGYCVGERNLDPVGPTRTVKPFAAPLDQDAAEAASDAAVADQAAAPSSR